MTNENKNLNNAIKNIIVNLLKSKGKTVPNFTPDTKINDILDYVELRRIIFMIDKTFKINSHYFVNDIINVKDLYSVVNMLYDEKLNNKKTQPQIITPKVRMLQNQKERVFEEIKDMLMSSDIVNDDEITMKSELNFDSSMVDFGVLESIEKKYNIVISDLSNVETVNDLCDIIVKQRISTFHTNKRIYNNNINYSPAPIYVQEKPLHLQYFGPFMYMGKKPPLSVRIQYQIEKLKQRFRQ